MDVITDGEQEVTEPESQTTVIDEEHEITQQQKRAIGEHRSRREQKQAEADRAERDRIRKFRDAFQKAISSPPVVHAEDRFGYGGEVFAPSKRGVGVLYTCTLCKEEHTYDIGNLADFGEFLEERARIISICTKPEPTPHSEQVLAQLKEIVAQLKILNTR